jgi:hypothetical protein
MKLKYKLRDDESAYEFIYYDRDYNQLHRQCLEYMREHARVFIVRRRYHNRTKFAIIMDSNIESYLAVAFGVKKGTKAEIHP